MPTLEVRAYDVRFGDAILVIIPDRDPNTQQDVTRHILIDVGNVLNTEGGNDAVFQPVVDEVLRELNGRPLDLYVSTHEHLDHVQGLYHVATKHHPTLPKSLATQYAWLTASAATDYYTRFPDAQKQKLALTTAYEQAQSHLALLPAADQAFFAGLLANNDPRSTKQCVDFLRTLASTTTFVYRGKDLTGTHPFTEATFAIWAPEEDASDYYKGLLPTGLAPGGVRPATSVASMEPPPGVDAGTFHRLLESRARGLVDNLLAIDKAANNTSIVFSIDWRGWTLLFAGDAELRSWRTMHERGVLRPVHFLKVSHHGSHNGTPQDSILETFLPATSHDGRPRSAVVSTWPDTYGGIPHPLTDARIGARCTLHSTLNAGAKSYVSLSFDSP
jgi:hypothetical protein